MRTTQFSFRAFGPFIMWKLREKTKRANVPALPGGLFYFLNFQVSEAA